MQGWIKEWVWRALLFIGVGGLGFLGCQLQGPECIQSSDCPSQQQCLYGWCRPQQTSFCQPPQSCQENPTETSPSEPHITDSSEPVSDTNTPSDGGGEQPTLPEMHPDAGEPTTPPDASEPPQPDTNETTPEAGPEMQPEPAPETVPETTPCPKTWLRTYGNQHPQEVRATAVDPQGNVWVGGRDEDSFLLHRYDPCGKRQWQLPMKGVDRAIVRALVVPSVSNVLFAGNIKPPGYLDGFKIPRGYPSDASAIVVGQTNQTTNKLDWLNGWGGEGGADLVQDLVTDSSGSLYITGQFRGKANFGTLTATGTGVKPAFVAKLNAQGKFQWVTVFNGEAPIQDSYYNSAFGRRIAADGSGNLYVVGQFRLSLSFGTTTFTSNSRGDHAFVTKLDANGKVLWARQWERRGSGQNDAFDVKLDSSGNPYVLGFFNSTIVVGTTTLNNHSKNDILVVKYDPQGNVLQTHTLGGGGEDFGHALALDSNNNIYIAGRVGSAVTFGTTTITTAGRDSLFVAKLNSQGILQWSYSGGAGEKNQIHRINLGPADTLYVAGEFRDTMVWGNQTYRSHGDIDLFVARLPRTQAPCATCLTNPCNTAKCQASNLVSAGKTHICGQLGGTMKCWGQNAHGKLGFGGETPNPTPINVKLRPGTSYARQIAVGFNFTCAIFDDQRAYCWGDNTYGTLGNGSTGKQTTPAPVLPPTGTAFAKTIASGSQHACAVFDDNQTYCWGGQGGGRLGNNSTSKAVRRQPTQVQFPSTLPQTVFTQSLALSPEHSCALMTDGSVYCWGKNTSGQLGDGTNQLQPTPVKVALPQGTTAVNLTVGHDHTCAILSDRNAYCWGNNASDQLGDGTGLNSNKPVKVKLPTGRYAKAIAAGESHTCAILDDYKIHCWGLNNNGQLGDGTTTKRLAPMPIIIPQGRSFATQLTANHDITCAIFDREHLYCWGFHVKYSSTTSASTSKTPTPTLVTF